MATDGQPPAPPEAVLLRRVRLAQDISVAEAASAAGVSKARWSQVEGGYESREGDLRPVVAGDGILARMAIALGIHADRIEAAGRGEAAEVMREIARRVTAAPAPAAPADTGAPKYADPAEQAVADYVWAQNAGSPELMRRGFVGMAIRIHRNQIAEKEAGERNGTTTHG